MYSNVPYLQLYIITTTHGDYMIWELTFKELPPEAHFNIVGFHLVP